MIEYYKLSEVPDDVDFVWIATDTSTGKSFEVPRNWDANRHRDYTFPSLYFMRDGVKVGEWRGSMLEIDKYYG